MTNPYAPPGSPAAGAPTLGSPGTFSLGDGLRDGLRIAGRYGLPLIGIWFLVAFATGLSIMLCFLPVLFVAPLLSYGSMRYLANTWRDTATFADVTSGTGNLGQSVGQMIVAFLIILFVSLPPIILSLVTDGIAAMADSDGLSVLLGLVDLVVQLGWALAVSPRLAFTTWLVADQHVPAFDALTMAWRGTERAWTTLALLQILLIAVFAPVVLVLLMGLVLAFIGVAGSFLSAVPELAELVDGISGPMAGLGVGVGGALSLGAFVVLVIGSIVAQGISASSYHQIFRPGGQA
jgi:hypothetical protein